MYGDIYASEDDFECESIVEFCPLAAAKKESFSVLLLVLENLKLYNIDLDKTDENGNTLLHICAAKGNLACVKKILSIGGVSRLLNKKQQTPLLLACSKDSSESLEIVELLVNHDNTLNVPDMFNETPIFHAVRAGSASMVKYLHSKGATLTHKNKIEESLLHVCDNAEVMRYLLQYKLNVNKASADGTTPLQVAVARGNVETVKLLIQNAAYIHVVDTKQRSLLHLAILYDRYDIAELLLKNKIDVNAVDEEGLTALHYAVDTGRMSYVALLLKFQAKVNVMDIDGYTPLHVAATKTNIEIIDLLTKRDGRAAVAKTFNGDIPIHIAARCGNSAGIYVLLNETDKFVKNFEGLTPIDVADDACKGCFSINKSHWFYVV